MSNSKVIKRMVFQIKIETCSPLSVSSGEDEWTDSDILRDGEGMPFVPGSSLKGAMRAYLGLKKNEKCLMGYSLDDNNGKMSSLYVSDVVFDSEVKISTRDGVALNDVKTAIDGSKFDTEIIEHGANGTFFIELVIRESDNETDMLNSIKEIFNGINNGEIRFGQKKTRGFGRFKVKYIKQCEFDKSNYLDYSKVYDSQTDFWKDVDKTGFSINKANSYSKKTHITVPLKLNGGISIRQYMAIKGQPDFTHITDNGVPVIPGSSLAGAIRHRISDILRSLQIQENRIKNIEGIISTAFGYVDNKDAHVSNIIIGEAEINGAKPLTMTRTGVSRFESAAKQGALYKERTYVGGTVDLEIMVNDGNDNNWIVGLLLLALKDLQNGYLAVGGETAIGRGVFEANGPMLINGESEKVDEYLSKLIENLKECKGGCL